MPRTPSPAPPEFQQGMAARAADLGDNEERARALGAAARAPGRPPGDLCAGPGPRAPGGGDRRAPATRCGRCRASRRSGSRTPTCCRMSGPRSGSRTASATRPSRAAVSRAPTRRRRRSRPRVRPGLPERERRPAARAPARAARPQRQLRRLPQAPHPRGGLPPVRPRPRQESRRRGAAGRQVRRPLAEWRAAGARPERDDPELGADPERNNAFRYAADDDARAQVPAGAHACRTYPRDSPIIGVARMHRIIRRSSSYGPMLPEGVLEDDGADRGILFFCLQASLARGFEFVKTQWVNDGTFFGTPPEMDPLAGPNDGTRVFTVPQQPIRRRLTELPGSWSTAAGVSLHARLAGARLDRRAGHVETVRREARSRWTRTISWCRRRPAGQAAAELAAHVGRRAIVVEQDRGGVVTTTGGARDQDPARGRAVPDQLRRGRGVRRAAVHPAGGRPADRRGADAAGSRSAPVDRHGGWRGSVSPTSRARPASGPGRRRAGDPARRR